MRITNVKLKSIISGVFSFLLSLALVLLFLLAGLYFGVFNDRIIKSGVNESNYYNEIHQEINDRAESIILESGLPAAVLDEIITLKRVYVSSKYYIEDALKGNEPVVNTERLRQEFEENIYKYLEKSKIARTDELDAGIEEIIAKVEQEYTRGIQFRFVNYIGEYKIHFMRFLKVSAPVLLLLAGVLCFFIIKMQKYKHRGVRYIAFAMISSAGITMITSVCLLITKAYNSNEQLPDYYGRFLTGYLKWDIEVFLYIGGIGAILSVLLITLVRYMKNNMAVN